MFDERSKRALSDRLLLTMITHGDVPMMRPVAFVTTTKHVHACHNLGYMALPDAMLERPDDGRYMVCTVEGREHTHMLVDMFDVELSKDYSSMGLGWHRLYPTADAAIMAAVMRLD